MYEDTSISRFFLTSFVNQSFGLIRNFVKSNFVKNFEQSYLEQSLNLFLLRFKFINIIFSITIIITFDEH